MKKKFSLTKGETDPNYLNGGTLTIWIRGDLKAVIPGKYFKETGGGVYTVVSADETCIKFKAPSGKIMTFRPRKKVEARN